MARKKQGRLKRGRSKEAREITAAVEKAGGTVTVTEQGHLRVSGPQGDAIVGSASNSGKHSRANTRATIRRETGLLVVPVPAKKLVPPAGDAVPDARPPQGRQRWHGEITRWSPGDTFGFITSAGG